MHSNNVADSTTSNSQYTTKFIGAKFPYNFAARVNKMISSWRLTKMMMMMIVTIPLSALQFLMAQCWVSVREIVTTTRKSIKSRELFNNTTRFDAVFAHSIWWSVPEQWNSVAFTMNRTHTECFLLLTSHTIKLPFCCEFFGLTKGKNSNELLDYGVQFSLDRLNRMLCVCI